MMIRKIAMAAAIAMCIQPAAYAGKAEADKPFQLTNTSPRFSLKPSRKLPVSR